MHIPVDLQVWKELRSLLSDLRFSDMQIRRYQGRNEHVASVAEFRKACATFESDFWGTGRRDFLRQIPDVYKIQLCNDGKRTHLLSLLRNLFENYIVNDKINFRVTCIAGGRRSYSVNEVLEDILWMSVLLGVDTALSTIKESEIPYRHVFHLPGVRMVSGEENVSKPLTIDNTTCSDPLIIDNNTHIYDENTTLLQERIFSDVNSHRTSITDFPLGDCYIIHKTSFPERFASPSQVQTSSDESFTKDYYGKIEWVTSFLDMLSLVKVASIQYLDHSCCVRSQELGLSFGSGGATSFEGMFPPFVTTTINQADVDSAKCLSDQYELLSKDMKDKLKPVMALWHLYAKLKRYLSFSNRLYNVSMLNTAIEVIFPSKESLRTARSAQYLGKTDVEWSDLEKNFKIFREYRNSLVHNLPIKNDFETEIRPALDLIEHCFCEVIMKIIENAKFPD